MTDRTAEIDRAREAIDREDWVEGYAALSALDGAPDELEPADLVRLADAAWWTGRMDEAITARQQAYAGYTASGEDVLGAGVAVRLAMDHFFRFEGAVGAGWLARAQRHLREGPEAFQHGLLACAESTLARFGGELEGSQALAQRAADIGRRLRIPDLVAMGVHLEGLTLIAAGRVGEGVTLLDEAMTSVVAGELTSYVTGLVYCNVLQACLALADLRRAGEWNEASRAWCESLPPGSPFPGVCRLNRAELAMLTGAWVEAETEASRALDEISRVNPALAGAALYESGEIRRREGDLTRAEAAFSRAGELGFEPQPGLALVRLAQGKPGAAVTALRLALGGETGNRLRRARLLAALVEADLAVDDLDGAAEAAHELDDVARAFGTAALTASAAAALGTVALARGDPTGAVAELRRAWASWQDVRLPYEAARTRMQIGLALRAGGDMEDALPELRAALAAFERLGAVRDAAAVSALLGATGELPGGLTAREAEVLRLVAAGKSNRDIASALVISEHTVARHLQNIFAKLGVSSRSAATAYAFEHGLT